MAGRDRPVAGGVLIAARGGTGVASGRPRLLAAALALLVAVACGGDDGAGADASDRVSPRVASTDAVEGDAAFQGERTSNGEVGGAAATDGDTVEGHSSAPADTPPAVDPVITRQRPSSDRSGSTDGTTGPRPLPPPVAIPAPEDRPVFERPEHVRGIYLNAWNAGSSRRIEQLVELARRTEINAFVIDIKDATGYVSHATGVEEARDVGAAGEIRIRDLPGLLRRLEAEGIWPIARIVIVKDPLLADARPDWAVQDTSGGVWVDSKEIRWLNLFDERVADYHIALAKEAVALGFPEVQWDYVRFADAPRADVLRARQPGRDGRPLTAAVRAFLERSREELAEMGAVVTADVFGVTTSAVDVGIGQVWEDFIDVVDVALPMVYPSHYWRGSFGIERPNAHPYEVVKHALERAVERSEDVEGAGAVRPWLQDFSLGEPDYGAPEVRAQIQATYDVGIEEWILWNPASRYTEEALMPADGWSVEPLMRVAGVVVPVSERHEALERARRQRADSVEQIRDGERADTSGAAGGR